MPRKQPTTIWANTPSNPTDWKDFFAVEYNDDSNYNLRFQADNAAPAHVELKVTGVQRHAYPIQMPMMI